MRQGRSIDDRDVVGPDAARDADLLIALQQSVIERAVGVDLALENGVVDAAISLIDDLVLGLVELRNEELLLVTCGLVVRLNRRLDRRDRKLQPACRVP